MDEHFIPKHGGYQSLASYQKAETVFRATKVFCERFLTRGDRTIDQMTQAARSGKQNIAEGSMASATSKESELFLTNVARASLEELLLDYHDYLKTHNLNVWDKNDERVAYVRTISLGKEITYSLYKKYIETKSDETTANIIICLIHQSQSLLRRQIDSLEREFIKNGGLREAMMKARLAQRKRNQQE